MEEFVDMELGTEQSGVANEPQAAQAESLSDVLNGLANEPAAEAQEGEETVEQTTQEETGGEEPVSKALRGRIKASERKGYERGKQEIEDKYRADLEELNNYRLQREVKELAEKEKISESLAERLIRAERGLHPATTQSPQMNQPSAAEPTLEQRAQSLFNQAQTIRDYTGLDVMELFNTNADVHQKVVSGEWDFKDVARNYGKQSAAHVPSPARSTNRSGREAKTIATMTDAEFEAFDKQLDFRSFDSRR